MGIPRPIVGVPLADLLTATACGAPAPQGSPSTSASPPPAEGRCVTSFDTGKDYFPVKQTLRHATNLTLTYADAEWIKLLGAAVALLCCVAPQTPGSGVVLPLNAVTTVLGALVVITVLLCGRVARTGLWV